MVPDLQQTPPAHLPPLGRELLEELRGAPEAGELILGGGIALSHYLEYRPTHDVDTWWRGEPAEAAWELAAGKLRSLAERHGLEFETRQWGDTRSAEARRGSRKHFSFQVSRRDVQLDAPRPSAWTPLWIETFRDNLASKMNALVNRGAPRDFQDVAEVCRRGLVAPADCWELWQLKNPGGDPVAARLAALNLLSRIEARRPIESVPAPERTRAAATRAFIRDQFCRP
jgi:hypothetical protein